MTIPIFGLLVLITLLAIAATAVPLAKRLGQPATVLLAALGLLHGMATTILGFDAYEGALDSYDLWFVAQLALDSQAMLYVFLPPLLFEMTLAVSIRRLMEDATVVMTMAILAVATATAAVGLSLWLASPISLVACLLLGAAVATTDPGAVISTFREIGAPRRLLVILEGESLLNDAAAIAIFGLLIAILQETATPSVAGVLADFLYSFGSGAVIGLLAAALAGRIYPWLAGSTAAEASLTVVLAYGAYIGAEQAFGGSGVVAVVFAGLMTGTTGFLHMAPGNWPTVRAVWAQIGFWANALIMILAASLAPGLIEDAGWMVAPLTLLVYAGAVAARASILFGLLPLMARLKISAPLTATQSYLVLWGGVRGSVTLVLAISLADLSVLGDDARLLAAVAAAYTLVTIFLNASTLAWLTRKLGLNRLSAADLALRERIVAGALERVRNVVGNLARARHIENAALLAVEDALGRRRDQVEAEADAQAGAARIAFSERLRLGLAMVAGQESRLVRRAFEEGAIGRRATSALRLDAERIADAARVDGREGYRRSAEAARRAPFGYRAAVFVQHRTGLDRPLREAIELHFTTLLESERVVRDLAGFARATLPPMIGEDAAANIVELLEARHRGVDEEIEAIAAQYPNYALEVERALLARAAIRRERQQYVRLLNDGVIGQELHDDLQADLARRERAAARPPRLDLTLTPASLLYRVPLFARLDDRQRRRVARALRTRFTTPGETVLRAGERGAAMFFIASGAFEQQDGGPATRLATGAFFGEIALLKPFARRKTSIVSLGYCRLLVLRRRDFQRLGQRDPTLEALIRAGAEEAAATTPVETEALEAPEGPEAPPPGTPAQPTS